VHIECPLELRILFYVITFVAMGILPMKKFMKLKSGIKENKHIKITWFEL
jgi:hypothetical protein